MLATEQGLGLYVHIPFCVRKCGYCDFNAGPAAEAVRDRYVGDLCSEVEQSPYTGAPARTVFFGGGTPSELSTSQLSRIVVAIERTFGVGSTSEWTIECNPGTVTDTSLREMRRMGFNRVSLGVQSFDDSHLRALGRIHTAADAKQAYSHVSAAGFDNRSIDLIFGLPGQTLEEWRSDLLQALELEPEHLSIYGLTIEKGTDFGIRHARGELHLPDEDTAADMFEQTMDVMGAAGFEQYEISNFARPGYRCEHNTIYWRHEPFIGFGVSAASYRDGRRWTNTQSLNRYHDQVSQGLLATEAEEHLGPRDAAAEAIMLALRTSEGVNLREVGDRYRIQAETLFGPTVARFRDIDLLEQCGAGVRLTRRGILLANVVCAEFLS